MVIPKENWRNDVVSKRNYRKSSIKPQGGLFISSTFEEGFNRDVGLI